jgi:hypothetical protein
MMRFLTIGLLALGLAVVSATSAQAGAISELTNNVVNELEDDNFESFFPDATHVAGGPFVVGDRFLGVIEIQGIDAPPGVDQYTPGANDQTFTGVFAIESLSWSKTPPVPLWAQPISCISGRSARPTGMRRLDFLPEPSQSRAASTRWSRSLMM